MADDDATLIDVSDATFETDILDRSRPVVVAFVADWCGPCRAVDSTLTQLADMYAEHVDVARIDVDRSPRTPSNYGVTSIPSLMLFVGGEVAGRVAGAAPQPELQQLFERALFYGDDTETSDSSR